MAQPGLVPITAEMDWEQMPRWTQFKWLTNKAGMSAIVAVLVLPLAWELLTKVGLSFEKLRVPIYGGVLYFVSYLVYKVSLPGVVQRYSSSDEYMEWAQRTNINVFAELKWVASAPEKEVVRMLGANAALMFPPEKGLAYARATCIREYAAIDYDLADSSKPFVRILVGLGLGVALVMINWLSLTRLAAAFVG